MASKPEVVCSCSLTRFKREVLKANLTDRHLDLFKTTPFSHFLSFPTAALDTNLLTDLLSRWNPTKQCFQIGNHSLFVRASDIAVILGLSTSGKTVVLNSKGEESVYIRKILGGSPVTFGTIEGKFISLAAQEMSTMDTVKLLVLYLFSVLLFPVSTGVVNSRCALSLDDFHQLHQYAWANAVHQFLIDNINVVHAKIEGIVTGKMKRKKVFLNGCAIALQAWLYEHVTMRTAVNMNFPRFLRWFGTGCDQHYKRKGFYQQFFEDVPGHLVHDVLNFADEEKCLISENNAEVPTFEDNKREISRKKHSKVSRKIGMLQKEIRLLKSHCRRLEISRKSEKRINWALKREVAELKRAVQRLQSFIFNETRTEEPINRGGVPPDAVRNRKTLGWVMSQ